MRLSWPDATAALRRPSRILVAALTGAIVLGVSALVVCRARRAHLPAAMSEEEQLRSRLASLTRQDQRLAAELALAKNPNPYLAVDLGARRIDFKARGKSLRTFPIADLKRAGGAAFTAQTWTEIEARPLQAPARAKMVPGSGEATTSSIATRDPWGPQRMPGDFDLICKENQALLIRSLPSATTGSGFTRWVVSGYRRTREWTRNLLGLRRSVYRESIELWLGEDDARLLFWSLPKQFSILIVDAS